jgi:hypothetical protein
METPETIRTIPVAPVQDPGVKFRGVKRALASQRNGFKRIKL